MAKHTTFDGWGVAIEPRTQAAIDAGHPEWAELPKSYSGAMTVDALHYFTGKLCKRGHVSPRWSARRNCVECEREYDQTPERKAYDREYKREYDIANAEKRKKQWRDYDKANPDKINASAAHRRALKLRATPPWLTQAHRDEITALYTEAQRLTDETGIPHHVDHIIPLNHQDVQGLHVPWNLTIITKSENCSKSNKFDGTHENESWRDELP